MQLQSSATSLKVGEATINPKHLPGHPIVDWIQKEQNATSDIFWPAEPTERMHGDRCLGRKIVARDPTCKWRVDKPRGHGVDADPRTGIRRSSRQDQPSNSSLGRSDRFMIGQSDSSCGTRHKHHRPTVLFQQSSGDTHRRKRGGEVGSKRRLPLVS